MKDNSKIVTIALVIITVIVVITTYLLNREDEPVKSRINIVTNYSDFYTVDSCLYRVTTYISTKDTKTLLIVLDDKYKKENNINENNVLELFKNINETTTFNSKKMYYEQINDNITKYYVYGAFELNELSEENSEELIESIDTYFIVYLDSTNQTFSIEPYSGEIFMEGE